LPVLDRIPGVLLNQDTWSMLQQGNQASAAPITRLLGRAPLSFRQFIPAQQAAAWRERSLWAWQNPMMRVALSLIWLGGGVMSLLAPQDKTLGMLAPLGLHGIAALGVLWGGIVLDLFWAALTLIKPCRRVWIAQLGTLILYTLLATLAQAGLWLDPFGALLKNLAIAVVLILLFTREPRA
jgi:hypothetical protein